MRLLKEPGRLLAAATWLHLAAVIALAVLYRLLGERLWGMVLLLYMPQAVIAAPSLVLVPGLLRFGPRRLLWAQAATLVLVLVVLMGLSVGHPRAPTRPERVVRVLTYNVWFGWGDRGHRGRVARLIADARPDIVLLQAVGSDSERTLRAALPGWNITAEGQFLLATRFPVRNARATLDLPGAAPGDPPLPGTHAMYTVDTPAGPLDLINIHPYSPREALELTRTRHHHRARMAMGRNIYLRQRQLEAALADARQARHPLVIAGDTNLQGASWLYRHTLAEYRDAWSEVGFGFGYTFPTIYRLAWLRLDRVLAGPGVRFLRVDIGGNVGSDHRMVIADLEIE